MDAIIYAVLPVLAVVALVVVSSLADNSVRVELPSGKRFPEDQELLTLCADQLMTDYSQEDLARLADYAEKKAEALSDEEEKEKWLDVVRRVNIAHQDYIY